jgi:hypothetical protein
MRGTTDCKINWWGIHEFHRKLVAQCFNTYYTQLLRDTAIYPGHFQGTASSIEVYSAYGNLSQINGSLYVYIVM